MPADQIRFWKIQHQQLFFHCCCDFGRNNGGHQKGETKGDVGKKGPISNENEKEDKTPDASSAKNEAASSKEAGSGCCLSCLATLFSLMTAFVLGSTLMLAVMHSSNLPSSSSSPPGHSQHSIHGPVNSTKASSSASAGSKPASSTEATAVTAIATATTATSTVPPKTPPPPPPASSDFSLNEESQGSCLGDGLLLLPVHKIAMCLSPKVATSNS